MKTKEAIERVRSRFDKWALDDEDLTALQTLGLVDAESEDEKIRKEIIDYLGLVGKGKGDYAQPMIDRWIAYLEKQKEQKSESGNSEKPNDHAEWSEDERIRKAALEGIEYLEHKLGWDFIGDIDILDVKEYLERLKEQKHKFKVGDRVTNGECVYTIEQVDKKIREAQEWKPSNEQKPAEWNEEDEELAEELIKLAEYYTDTEDETEFKPHISWLKALPERFNLQPKQERSETVEENKGEMISPFTGGRVVEENVLTEVEYRGAKYSVPRKYYKCVDTGRQFSTSEQDGDLIWSVFRKYCEERNFDTFRDLLPEGKFSNTAVTNLFETYNNNKDRLQFPHLEIYHSGVMDWCVRIYEQDGIGSGSKENVIVDVQHCDPSYAFAKAESTLKEWLLKNKDGY